MTALIEVTKYLMSMEFIAGYRSYVAVIGLICLAGYQFSVGDYETAYRNLAEALAFFGVRQAIAK